MDTPATHAPLPRLWFTPGSNDELWGRGGTYKAIAYESLPPLPAHPGGELAWLAAAPEIASGLGLFDGDGDEEGSAADFGPVIDRLSAEAAALGLALPPALRPFMTDPALHGRVPTCTACYIELSNRLVPLPDGHPGRLVRFLNDQQCCLIWYLHLTPDGGHTVLCGAPEFHDGKGDTLEDVATPRDLVVCAPSFEAFLHRFWLENTIWYAVYRKRPLNADERAYCDAAKRAQDTL